MSYTLLEPFRDYDAFLVDLDGTVYLGDQLLPKSKEALWAVVESGRRLLYLTNNPFTTRHGLQKKLDGFGLPTENCPIVTAAAAAAWYAAQHLPPQSTVFVLGADSLKEDCLEAGLRVASTGKDPGIGATIVGGAFNFDYEGLKEAAWAVRSSELFVATNNDPKFPMEDDFWPGTGAILAAVETAAQRKAEVVGKPNSTIFKLAEAELKLPHSARVLMIGDSLGTDVAGGLKAGHDAALVLTGNNTREHVEAARKSGGPTPQHVLPCLGSLVDPT